MCTLGRFLLYPGELLRLDLGTSVGLRCDSGRLLVTASRGRGDHELRRGERVECEGLVLVEGPGELRVDRACRLPWPFSRERIELIGIRPDFNGERHV